MKRFISANYTNLQISPSEANYALTQLWKADAYIDLYSYPNIMQVVFTYFI
jgi:hypothetical protein